MGPFFKEGGPIRGGASQSYESVPEINMQSAEVLHTELSQRLAEGGVVTKEDYADLTGMIQALLAAENALPDNVEARYKVARMRAELSALKKQIDTQRFSLKKAA